eukprot:4157130-Amphidinium_carterae.1
MECLNHRRTEDPQRRPCKTTCMDITSGAASCSNSLEKVILPFPAQSTLYGSLTFEPSSSDLDDVASCYTAKPMPAMQYY